MPFKSQAQRGFMYANHPKMAKEFEAATPEGKLPEHVKKMAFGGETNPEHETVKSMENNPSAGFADGGEVKKDSDIGTLAGLRELMKQHYGGPTESTGTAKEPIKMDVGGDVPANPSIGDTTQALNSTPPTNYDFYKNISAEDRAALAQNVLQQQRSGGNMAASGLAGLGDAISNSFGGQKTNYQQNVMENQKNMAQQQLSAVDTQRAQRLQDMQGQQEAMMNDPKHPFSQGMRDILKKQGITVPSGMNANIMLKVLGPLGELSYKQAMMGIQGGALNNTIKNEGSQRDLEAKRLAQEATNQNTSRKLEGAKGLAARPLYQKAIELIPGMKSEATKTLESAANGQPGAQAPMTATNPQTGHKITSTDGGQTWQ